MFTVSSQGHLISFLCHNQKGSGLSRCPTEHHTDLLRARRGQCFGGLDDTRALRG